MDPNVVGRSSTRGLSTRSFRPLAENLSVRKVGLSVHWRRVCPSFRMIHQTPSYETLRPFFSEIRLCLKQSPITKSGLREVWFRVRFHLNLRKFREESFSISHSTKLVVQSAFFFHSLSFLRMNFSNSAIWNRMDPETGENLGEEHVLKGDMHLVEWDWVMAGVENEEIVEDEFNPTF